MYNKRVSRGVFCLFCGQPIPLRSRVLSFVLSRREEAQAAAATESGVLVLQCRTCCKEALYPVREIVPLDGPEPMKVFEPRAKRRAASDE